MMNKEKKASIKDVAREADVSLATVSRVINRLDGVKPVMQQRVLDAIAKLGYSPNHAARALVTQRTNTIGIVVNNLHDPFFYDLIKGFEMGAQQTSYSVIFCSVLGGDVKSKETYVKYLSNGVVDAIILYGSYLSDESVIRYLHENSKTEYVMIENDAPSVTCNKLLIDNIGGASDAINYLIEKGHKRIAHICGNPDKMVTMDRFNGYIQTMSEAGFKVREGYIQYTSTDYKSGYERMKALLALPAPPSAVFCSDDAIASYAVRAAMDMGLRVPEDISVMGFDNQSILPDLYRGPVITSVEQPLYTIGMESIRLLSGRLNQEEPGEVVRKVYKTKIIEGETVGAYHEKL